MANYVDMFWQVRVELPGVPLPLLHLNYAETVREFFQRSLAWQHSVPNALDLNANTAWPTLTAPADIPEDTYVVQPVRVKFDGTDVTFKTRDQLDEIDMDWEAATGSSPDHWTITSPGTWRVYPLLSANASDMIRLRVALAPVQAATAIPDELANEFQAAWKNGTLAKLLKIPGKDWTNNTLAASYMTSFEDDIVKAKSRAAADFGRPHRTVQYGGLSINGSGRRSTDDYGK
jgi:hypothetical protein